MRHNNIKIAITMFLMFVGYSSCDESKLDVKPQSQTEDAYFVEEIEFERAIYGVYAKLTDFYWYNAGQNNCVLPAIILPGDDITTAGQDEFEIFSNMNAGSGRLGYLYTAIYQMINRATIVLDKNAAVEDGIYVTPGLKDYHRGEALFLRAYSYYQLWNLFGTAPLVTARVKTLEETKPPGSTGTQLLDQAIADLTEAATLLPASWPEQSRGRVTSNSANGLLGKCLVFKGTISGSAADYQSAISAFEKISGVSLVPAFDDNYAADTENNAESLFEYQATQAFGFDNPWLSNDFDNAVGALSVFWGFYSNHSNLFGKAPFIATQKLASVFEAGDPRLALSLNPTTLEFKKYVTRDQQNQSGSSSVNNPRILRYADVLLLKAEALNESGGSAADAIAQINLVRARARGAGTSPAARSTSVTDRAVIRQWIMDERLMELSGEGQRWFDLRRWALAGQVTLNNAFFSSAVPGDMGFVPDKHINFPIPDDETNVNPNVVQNPGY
ncbi:MAG TPA: RagB/SusD family nutrient uptake outer membrane protein [Chryseolinea sp.]|nr:RagB/SusD family nutrient uptake outer membrane protein [Chryseolinea sp.]